MADYNFLDRGLINGFDYGNHAILKPISGKEDFEIVPSEYSASPFVFELITTDMEKLADTIFYLIKGIVLYSETTAAMEKYWADKEKFWEQYYKDEIVPVCYGLLHILENNLKD